MKLISHFVFFIYGPASYKMNALRQNTVLFSFNAGNTNTFLWKRESARGGSAHWVPHRQGQFGEVNLVPTSRRLQVRPRFLQVHWYPGRYSSRRIRIYPRAQGTAFRTAAPSQPARSYCYCLAIYIEVKYRNNVRNFSVPCSS